MHMKLIKIITTNVLIYMQSYIQKKNNISRYLADEYWALKNISDICVYVRECVYLCVHKCVR